MGKFFEKFILLVIIVFHLIIALFAGFDATTTGLLFEERMKSWIL